MSDFDELVIHEPHSFERQEGKIIITCGDEVVHSAEPGRLHWEHTELKWVLPMDAQLHYLGHYNGEQVFSVELGLEEVSVLSPRSSGLRHFLGSVPDGLFRLLGRALQINEWYRGHRHCGWGDSHFVRISYFYKLGCMDICNFYR